MDKDLPTGEKNILTDCVNRGMSFLGEDVVKSTVYFLERKTGRALHELLNEPERFSLAVRELFGPGSHLIFESILAEISLMRKEGKGNHRLANFASVLEESRISVEAGIL